MTAEGAGVSERERLAAICYGQSTGAAWKNRDAGSFDVENAYADADEILAAGFGDVAEAKAEIAQAVKDLDWARANEGLDAFRERRTALDRLLAATTDTNGATS